MCILSHISRQKGLGDPGFLYEATLMFACGAFSKESRMKFADPGKTRRKSGVWGNHFTSHLDRIPRYGAGALGRLSRLAKIR
jgi:hypothetical protein